jgi:hypothetical protein
MVEELCQVLVVTVAMLLMFVKAALQFTVEWWWLAEEVAVVVMVVLLTICKPEALVAALLVLLLLRTFKTVQQVPLAVVEALSHQEAMVVIGARLSVLVVLVVMAMAGLEQVALALVVEVVVITVEVLVVGPAEEVVPVIHLVPSHRTNKV